MLRRRAAAVESEAPRLTFFVLRRMCGFDTAEHIMLQGGLRMKKCFALLLALLLALGLTATAFAVEGEAPTRPSITVDGQTYEDITEVPITKLYQRLQ